MASLLPTLCPSCGTPIGTRKNYQLREEIEAREIGTIAPSGTKIKGNVDLFEKYGIINTCCRCVITTTVFGLHNIRAPHNI